MAGASTYSGVLAPPWWKCRASNAELLNSLKESEASAELHRLTLEDADKGRMSKPCDASAADLDSVCCVFASMHHVIALCFSAGALGT